MKQCKKKYYNFLIYLIFKSMVFSFLLILTITENANAEYKTSANYSIGNSTSNPESGYVASKNLKYWFGLSYCTDSSLICSGLGFGLGSINGKTVETEESTDASTIQYYNHYIGYRQLNSQWEIYPFVKARQKGAVPLDLVFLGNFALNSYTSKDIRSQSSENTSAKYSNIGIIPSFEYGVGLEGTLLSNLVYQFSISATDQKFLVNENSTSINTQSFSISLAWMPASGKSFRKK